MPIIIAVFAIIVTASIVTEFIKDHSGFFTVIAIALASIIFLLFLVPLVYLAKASKEARKKEADRLAEKMRPLAVGETAKSRALARFSTFGEPFFFKIVTLLFDPQCPPSKQ